MAETLIDVNHIHPLKDFVQGGLDYLPGDFLKERKNLVTFLTIYLDRLRLIDEMLVNLAEGRLLANASYLNLDEIGRQIGVERNGMDDDSFRAQITILLASASKHGTRPEVTETLRQVFGDNNFRIYKGDNFRIDIHILDSCFEIADLLPEILDMLPLPTHLRFVKSVGRAFGFTGDAKASGFSSFGVEPTTVQGGLAGMVYTSDTENEEINKRIERGVDG